MTAPPRQLPLPWPHKPSLAREDLVESGSNRLAVAAVDAWPLWPHPVVFVAGPPGSGKSHLGAAWSQMAGATPFDPEGFDFGRTGFAVFLDDLDRAGFAERDVFSLLNAARLGNGTVLVTARGRPQELDLRTADLRSRLAAATTIDLGAPDDALLQAVLAKLFTDRQIDIDPRLIAWMAARMERSLDAARTLAEDIDRESLAQGRRPTRALIQKLLQGESDKGKGLS